MTHKLTPGTPLPEITVPLLEGGEMTLGTNKADDWQAIIVYRGQHCPICHSYAGELEAQLEAFAKAGVEVVLVSADNVDKAREFVDDTGTGARMAYGLTIEQMEKLGLYMSDPRSPEETNHVFPEPALFVVNGDGTLQIIDIANAPFVRPDLARLARGIAFVREKDYPIRGRHAA